MLTAFGRGVIFLADVVLLCPVLMVGTVQLAGGDERLMTWLGDHVFCKISPGF